MFYLKGEMASVKKAVTSLLEKENTVDVLVCNGGVLLNEKQKTKEGNEVTFASHLLGGSYLLSQLLIPQLKASTDPRIIFVSSGGMYTSPFPDWDTATSSDDAKHKYDGQLAYAYAKRGQVLLADEYAKLYSAIPTVSVHPGWTLTPAVDIAYGDNKKYLEPMRTTWQGVSSQISQNIFLLFFEQSLLTNNRLHEPYIFKMSRQKGFVG